MTSNQVTRALTTSKALQTFQLIFSDLYHHDILTFGRFYKKPKQHITQSFRIQLPHHQPKLETRAVGIQLPLRTQGETDVFATWTQ